MSDDGVRRLSVRSTLSTLTDTDLVRLMAVSTPAPGMSPGLPACLEHLADWEMARRRGQEFPLQDDPSAAIDADELVYALRAVALLLQRFSRMADEPIARLLWVIGEGLRRSPSELDG